MFSHADCTF
jgi:hypothetical protein